MVEYIEFAEEKKEEKKNIKIPLRFYITYFIGFIGGCSFMLGIYLILNSNYILGLLAFLFSAYSSPVLKVKK